MLRLVATLLSEGVALDAVTGRLTAFNMIETVTTPITPVHLFRLFVITLYDRDMGDVSLIRERISIKASEGATVTESLSELVFVAPHHKSIHQLNYALLPQEGRYDVIIEHAPTGTEQWTEIGRRDFYVAKLPPPVTPEHPG